MTLLRETSITTNSEEKPFLKGILINMRKKKRKSQQFPSLLESKSESKAASPESNTWDMDEMRLVGEVIRDDFVKPLSKDMVHIRQNIVELVLYSNECRSGEYSDDSFAEQIEHNHNSAASPIPISIKKTYALGIRSKGTKKSRKNGLASQIKKTRGKK